MPYRLLLITLLLAVFTFAGPTPPRLAPRAEYCDIPGQELCTGLYGYSICWRGILDYSACPPERPVCRQVTSVTIECLEGRGGGVVVE